MSQHDDAIAAFQEGRPAEALRLLEELLAVKETSDLWNDWAAVQLGSGNISQAENGFARALELDSQNSDAAANLGLLLLSRGDSARAIPLLTQALPALPAQHQKLVGDLLAARAAAPPTHDGRTSAGQSLRILVISDTFPGSVSVGGDARLLDLLRAWREQGNEVSFIAREAENREQCEPALHEAGIRIYGNDPERLPCLGREASDSGPSWSFRGLLEQERFDVAILMQSFRRGISVCEQYLDDLRLHSPGNQNRSLCRRPALRTPQQR